MNIFQRTATALATATALTGFSTAANACSGAYLFETPAQANSFAADAGHVMNLAKRTGDCRRLDRTMRREFDGVVGYAPLLNSNSSSADSPIYKNSEHPKVARWHVKDGGNGLRVGTQAGSGTKDYEGTPVNLRPPVYKPIPYSGFRAN